MPGRRRRRRSTVEYQIARLDLAAPSHGRRVCHRGGALPAGFVVRYSAGRRRLRDGAGRTAYRSTWRTISAWRGPWKGHETEETLLELKALGAEYVVIHGAKSREYYRDFFRTERISGSLPAVFHIEDDTIYALPVRSLAHLMKPEELPDADVPYHPQSLVRYVAAMEDSVASGSLRGETPIRAN